MKGFIRPVLWLTLLSGAVFYFGAVHSARAQSSARAAAQQATEQWLTLVDAGKYGESWDAAAPILKNNSGRKDWIAYLKDKRQRLGKVASRKLLKADPLKNVPGLPPGRFVGMQYLTSFEKLKNGVEVVVPVLDQDGKWRVSEYVVQPAQAQ
jgi:hypothetical protein